MTTDVRKEQLRRAAKRFRDRRRELKKESEESEKIMSIRRDMDILRKETSELAEDYEKQLEQLKRQRTELEKQLQREKGENKRLTVLLKKEREEWKKYMLQDRWVMRQEIEKEYKRLY